MATTEVKLEKATNLLYFIIWAFVYLLVLPGAIALMTNWIIPFVDPSLNALTGRLVAQIYVVAALAFFPFLRNSFPNYSQKIMNTISGRFRYTWGFWIAAWFGIPGVIQFLTLVLFPESQILHSFSPTEFYTGWTILGLLMGFYYLGIFKRLEICRSSEKPLLIGTIIGAASVEIIVIALSGDLLSLVLLKLCVGFVLLTLSYVPKVNTFIGQSEESYSRLSLTMVFLGLLNLAGIYFLVVLSKILRREENLSFPIWIVVLIGIIVLLKINLLFFFPFLYGNTKDALRPYGLLWVNSVFYFAFVGIFGGISGFLGLSPTQYMLFPLCLMAELYLEHRYFTLPVVIRRWMFVVLYLLVASVFSFWLIAVWNTVLVLQIIIFTVLCLFLTSLMFRMELISETGYKIAEIVLGILIYFEIAHGLSFWSISAGVQWNTPIWLIYAIWYSTATLVTGYRLIYGPLRKGGAEPQRSLQIYLAVCWMVFWALIGGFMTLLLKFYYYHSSQQALLLYPLGVLILILGLDITVVIQKPLGIFPDNFYWKVRQIALVGSVIICTIWRIGSFISYTLYLLALFLSTIVVYSWFLTLPKLTPEVEARNQKWSEMLVYVTLVEIMILVMALLIEYLHFDFVSSLTAGLVLVLVYERNVPVVRDSLPIEKRIKIRTFVEWAIAGFTVYTIFFLVHLVTGISISGYSWVWMLVGIWIFGFLHRGLQALGSYDHIPLIIADRICCIIDYLIVIISFSFLFFAIPFYYAFWLTMMGTLFASFIFVAKYANAFNFSEKMIDNIVLGIILGIYVSFSASFMRLALEYWGWSILGAIFVTGLIDWGMSNIAFIKKMLGKRNISLIHATAILILPILGWFALITSSLISITFNFPIVLWTGFIITTSIVAMLGILSERVIPLVKLLPIYQIVGVIEVGFIALLSITYFFISQFYFSGLFITCLILMGVIAINHRITLFPLTKIAVNRIWAILILLECLFGTFLLVDILSAVGVSLLFAYPLAIALFLTIILLPLQMLFDIQRKLGPNMKILRLFFIGGEMICFLFIYSPLFTLLNQNTPGIIAVCSFLGLYGLFSFGSQLIFYSTFTFKNQNLPPVINTPTGENSQGIVEIPPPTSSIPIPSPSPLFVVKFLCKQFFGLYLGSLLAWGILNLTTESVLNENTEIASVSTIFAFLLMGICFWMLPRIMRWKHEMIHYLFILVLNTFGIAVLIRFFENQWVYSLLLAALVSILAVNPKWHVELQYFYGSTVAAISIGIFLFQSQVAYFPVVITVILFWLVANYGLIRYVKKKNDPRFLSPFRWGMLGFASIDFCYFAIVDFATFSGLYYLGISIIAFLFYRSIFDPTDKFRRNIALGYLWITLFMGIFVLSDHTIIFALSSTIRFSISLGFALLVTTVVNLKLQQLETFSDTRPKVRILIGSWFGILIGSSILFAAILFGTLYPFIERGVLGIIVANFVLLFGNKLVRVYRVLIGPDSPTKWQIYRPLSGVILYGTIGSLISYYIPTISLFAQFFSNFHLFWQILTQIWVGFLLTYGGCLLCEKLFKFFIPRVKVYFLLYTWLPQTLIFALLISRFLESPILGILFFIGMTYLSLHYAVALNPDLNTVLVRKALSLLFLIGIFAQLELWFVPIWNLGSPVLPHLLSASITLGIILLLINFNQLPKTAAPFSSILFGFSSALFEYLLFYAINPDLKLIYLGFAIIIFVNCALSAIKRFHIGIIYWAAYAFACACSITNLIQIYFPTRFLLGDWFLFGAVFNGTLYWILRVAVANENFYKTRFLLQTEDESMSDVPSNSSLQNQSSILVSKGLGYIFPMILQSMELVAIIGFAFALSFGVYIITTLLWAVTLLVTIPPFDYIYILILCLICVFSFFNIPNMRYIREHQLFIEYPFLKNVIESYSNNLGQAIYISIGLLGQRFSYFRFNLIPNLDLSIQISLSCFIGFFVFYVLLDFVDKKGFKMLSPIRRMKESIIGWMGAMISLGIFVGWITQSFPLGVLLIVIAGYQGLQIRLELPHHLQVEKIRNIFAILILLLIAAIVQMHLTPVMRFKQSYNSYLIPFGLNLLILIWVYIGLEKIHACTFKRVEVALLGGAIISSFLIMFLMIGELAYSPLYTLSLSFFVIAGYIIPLVKPRQLWFFVWFFIAGGIVFSIIEIYNLVSFSVATSIISGIFLYLTILLLVARISVFEDLQFNQDPSKQHQNRLYIWKDWENSQKMFVRIWLTWSVILGFFIANLQYLWLALTVNGIISAILILPVPMFLSFLACFNYIRTEKLWEENARIEPILSRLQIITGFYIYGSLPAILTLNIASVIVKMALPLIAQVSLITCIPTFLLLLELRVFDYYIFKFLKDVTIIRNRVMGGLMEILALFSGLFFSAWSSTIVLIPVWFFGLSLFSYPLLKLPSTYGISVTSDARIELSPDFTPALKKIYFSNQLVFTGSLIALVGYLFYKLLVLANLFLSFSWWIIIYLSLIYIALSFDYRVQWITFAPYWRDWLRAGIWSVLMLCIVFAITFSIIPPPGWLILLAILVPTIMAFYLERLVAQLPDQPSLNRVQKVLTPLNLGLSLYIEIYLFFILLITPLYFDLLYPLTPNLGLGVTSYLAIIGCVGLAIHSFDYIFKLIPSSIHKKIQIGFVVPITFLLAGVAAGFIGEALAIISFDLLSRSLIAILGGTIIVCVIFIPYFKNRLLNQLLYLAFSIELILILFFVGESEVAVTSLIFLILLYPFLFFLEKVRMFLTELLNRIQAFFASLKAQLIEFFRQIQEFFRKNWRIFWIGLEIGIMILTITIGILTQLSGFVIFFMTALILVVLAYPLSPEREYPEDAHILAQKISYRALLYVCFIGLLFTTAFDANFISILGAAIVFMALLVWLARRAETLYQISIKWRFIFSVVTILLIGLLVVGMTIF
jgi:hypothetical protein